jgi:hypothetical protein
MGTFVIHYPSWAFRLGPRSARRINDVMGDFLVWAVWVVPIRSKAFSGFSRRITRCRSDAWGCLSFFGTSLLLTGINNCGVTAKRPHEAALKNT